MLLMSCAGLWAQATYTGKFQGHTVTFWNNGSCGGLTRSDATYTTSSATLPLKASCNGSSITGQVDVQFPDTIPGAILESSAHSDFKPATPVATSVKLSGHWTVPDGNYYGSADAWGIPVGCPDSSIPKKNLPIGAADFPLTHPCTFTQLIIDNGSLVGTSYTATVYTYVSVYLQGADNRGWSTSEADIASTYLFTTAQAGPVAPRDVPPDPLAPRQTTDSRFVGRSPSKCVTSSGGPLTIPVNINRVVGAPAGDGTLSNAQLLTDAHVISQAATLRLPVFHRILAGSTGETHDHIRFNGNEIGLLGGQATLRGPNETWTLNSFDVPISLLRFGQRNPGQAPTPGNNVIEIQVDTQSPSGQENWCTASDWAELSFNAVAPVIMIHGNGQGDDGQGGQFWAGAILGDKTRLQMPFSFISALDAAGLVYDNSISMKTATIATNGDLLAALIPRKAAEFGAKHVHLVAHSKGGLDSRDFLARTIPPNFGVLSLTTLSTPHHGSAGPDYQLDAVGASAMDSDDATRTLIGQRSPPNPGTSNLRVSFVEDFNQTNIPLLPTHLTVDGEERPVVYQSISADANLDDSKSFFGNPTIEYSETAGIPGQGSLLDTIWALVVEQVYRLIGNVVSTHAQTIDVTTMIGDSAVTVPVKVVRQTLSPAFILNDFAVNVDEARIEPFVEITSVKANHSTIASPDVARIVIGAILKAQPVQ
jgi:hypothetical protein